MNLNESLGKSSSASAEMELFEIYNELRHGEHYPPLLPPGQGSMTIFNVLFLILQSTSFDRIWPKVNLFWSDFGEKCIFRVF